MKYCAKLAKENEFWKVIKDKLIWLTGNPQFLLATTFTAVGALKSLHRTSSSYDIYLKSTNQIQLSSVIIGTVFVYLKTLTEVVVRSTLSSQVP